MYTREKILQVVEEKDVKFIRLQFTDIFGVFKNVVINKNQLEKALDNKCMFDGSSIDGFARIEESDMYLYPDLDTFMVYPWHGGDFARLICDVYTSDGKPFEGDPRYVLKKVLCEAKEEFGFTINVGPECEFFLFHMRDREPIIDPVDQGGYFEFGPVDKGENVRSDICTYLEQMGFEVETSHHECAPGQHEIDFKYSEALKAADNIATFKLAVKSIADKHNMFASFMPKPLMCEAGSGMHINISVCKDGKNIFCDEDTKRLLSTYAENFIAGIMKHAKGMTCIMNPIVNSYKRLVPGFEAPMYISWSTQNRSPLIRVPAARGESTRIEIRSADSAANPYLALAVCLKAGLSGIRENMSPLPEINYDIFSLDSETLRTLNMDSIPLSLRSAINEMRQDEMIKETLGDHIFERYISYKQQEWCEYRNIVTQWELDKYLKN